MLAIIREVEESQKKASVPSVSVGDTIVVSTEIVEGKKKRIQKYEGIVIKAEKNGIRANFTVRKLVDGVGVEKTFLIHSPLLKSIDLKQKGSVRRSKLYYLRDRVGKKATRVKTREE